MRKRMVRIGVLVAITSGYAVAPLFAANVGNMSDAAASSPILSIQSITSNSAFTGNNQGGGNDQNGGNNQGGGNDQNDQNGNKDNKDDKGK